jgi:hypothetical protein
MNKFTSISIWFSAAWIIGLLIARFYNEIFDIGIGHGGIDPLSMLSPYLVVIGCVLFFLTIYGAFIQDNSKRIRLLVLAVASFDVIIPILFYFQP